MIVLADTTDKITVVLDGAVTTNECQCVASWRDITTTPRYEAGRSVANTNGTTDVDLVDAPTSSTQRLIDFISIYNKDTVGVTVTLKYDDNGTEYILVKKSLASGESLIYATDVGFFVL